MFNKKEYMKEYYKNNKKDFLNRNEKRKRVYDNIMKELKMNGCAVCGYNDSNVALAFHHVNEDDKRFTINQNILCKRNKDIVDELNKCILLCFNCHQIIHYG